MFLESPGKVITRKDCFTKLHPIACKAEAISLYIDADNIRTGRFCKNRGRKSDRTHPDDCRRLIFPGRCTFNTMSTNDERFCQRDLIRRQGSAAMQFVHWNCDRTERAHRRCGLQEPADSCNSWSFR